CYGLNLHETFSAHYTSVKDAKVVTDKLTGHTKGYGFVKFRDESEKIRATTKMNGRLCSTRSMRIGPPANKKSVVVFAKVIRTSKLVVKRAAANRYLQACYSTLMLNVEQEAFNSHRTSIKCAKVVTVKSIQF
ncbi:polyadenylate-binding protein RBP45, partial [Tanacetum coccineum]